MMIAYKSIEAWHRSYSFIIGALLMADGVITAVNGTYVFFPDVHPAFKFIVGFIVVVTATPQLQKSKE